MAEIVTVDERFLSDGRTVQIRQPAFFFIGRYVAHLAILVAVVGAVSCSVATQYGVKFLIDTLAQGPKAADIVAPFAVLAILISADNLLWRLACWIGSFTFVRVSGDLRRELFRHLTGHRQTIF